MVSKILSRGEIAQKMDMTIYSFIMKGVIISLTKLC
jgi:hypothetical protein